MNDEMISVIEAGRQLDRRKSTIFKVMKRLGIHAQKRRDSNRGNQVAAYLTHADFIRVKEALIAPGPDKSEEVESDIGDSFISAEIGVFYLIQLEPEHDSLRFKVGFAANINERLRALRCSAPFSTVVKSWPCRRLWEKTAIDCVTFGCDRLHTEVFRCSSLEAVVAKCEQFFGIMPPA
ncbi:MAG: GIY-YIG nuclease family protein [Thermoguttaceae bacterium]